MSLIERITSEIKAYHALPTDTTDIVGLIDRRKRLSVLSFGLAKELADLHTEKSGAEYMSKSKQAKTMAAQFTDGQSAAKALQIAKIESVDELKEELMTEAAYRGLSLILQQTNEVLSCMSQHIANLRQEHRAESTGTGSQ